MSDEKERFKAVVREMALHLMGGDGRIPMPFDDDRTQKLIEKAIFAGVQLAKPPNAFALAGALRGCSEYVEAAAKHGCLDVEKLRATGLLPPEMMLPRWREPLDKLFIPGLPEQWAVEESSLPSKQAPPAQEPDK